jgi:hypothetical protein
VWSRSFIGVKAEGQALESTAPPLTAEDVHSGKAPPGGEHRVLPEVR